MSFLNARAKQVYCKVAFHGSSREATARCVETMGRTPGFHVPDDELFHAVEFAVSTADYQIGTFVPHLCLYAPRRDVEGEGLTRSLLLGADGIVLVIDGSAAARAADLDAVASMRPYLGAGVGLVVACTTPELDASAACAELGLDAPTITLDVDSGNGVMAALRAVMGTLVATARAKWVGP